MMNFNLHDRALSLRALLRRTGVAGAVALALSSCGGGGGGEATSAVSRHDDSTAVILVPSCDGCAALDNNTYAGSGVGIWHASNTRTAPSDLRIAIAGLNNNDVTLIFSNATGNDVVMPGTALHAQLRSAAAIVTVGSEPSAMEKIREFNRTGWAELVGSSAASPFASGGMPRMNSSTNGIRDFNDYDGVARTTTLKKSASLSDGTVVNIWVESTEIADTKVTDGMAQQLLTSFSSPGGIYDMLKDTGGALWGPHKYPELISGSSQPIEIVVLNIDKNGRPYDTMGYFHALNNVTRTKAPKSNESVSLYLDAETMYLDGAKGMQAIISTLAHEGMHMSNYYRRGVVMGAAYQYETWLEEMSAQMMEDAASMQMHADYNAIRDLRFPQYLQFGSYNCSLFVFRGAGAPCDSYAVTGSFGGYMLRQMGMPFLRSLLAQPVSGSQAALEEAIRAFRPASGIGTEMRKFAAAAISAVPPAGAPADFAFPARSDGSYVIPAINPQLYKHNRALPSAMPAMLAAYAHYPVVRTGISGTFEETVQIPGGTSLTVVVN